MRSEHFYGYFPRSLIDYFLKFVVEVWTAYPCCEALSTVVGRHDPPWSHVVEHGQLFPFWRPHLFITYPAVWKTWAKQPLLGLYSPCALVVISSGDGGQGSTIVALWLAEDEAMGMAFHASFHTTYCRYNPFLFPRFLWFWKEPMDPTFRTVSLYSIPGQNMVKMPK